MDCSVLEAMRDSLTCSVCFKLFVEPKSLACQHTFCKECLAQHIETKIKVNEELKCPLCNEHISKDAAETTQTHFNYASMIEKLKEHCGYCVEGSAESEAVGRCQDCQILLCRRCVDNHKRNRKTFAHNVTMLQRDQRHFVLPTETNCSLHPLHPLSLYCISHDKVVCTACTVISHRDCSVSYIDKKTVENECQSLVNKVDSLKQLHEQLKKEKNKLEKEKQQLNASHSKVNQQITDHCDTVKEEIDRETTTLREELNDWYKLHMKKCALQYESTESQVNNISHVITRCELLVNKQPAVETLVEKTELSQQILKLEGASQTEEAPTKEEMPFVNFVEKGSSGILLTNETDNIHLKVLSESPSQNETIEVFVGISDDRKVNEKIFAGSVNNKHVDVINNDNGGYTMTWTPNTHLDQHVQVEIAECRVKQAITIPIKRSYNPLIPVPTELSLTSSPLGVCLISDNKMAVTSNGKKIKMVDTATFTEIDEIDGSFVRPYFMAVDGTNDNLWVTDREAHNVKRISLTDHRVTLQYGSRGAGFSQLSHPRGIAVSPDNNRVYVSDMRNNRIVILNIQNDNTVLESTTIGQSILNQPSGITFNRKGELAVCDDRNCRIALFSPNGKLVQYMGVSRDNIGLLCSPIGITVDNHGRYIVGEFGSHSVTALSTEGNILSCTRTVGGVVKEFTYPRGVAVDNNGYIFVADYGNKRIVKL